MSKTAKTKSGEKLKRKNNRQGKSLKLEEKAETLEFLKSGENVSDSLYYPSEENGWEELDQEDDESFLKVRVVLSRTSMLLYDYHQFKSARIIQAAVRGWLARTKYLKWRDAAKEIQRAWRGYSAKVRYFDILEQKVKEKIEKHHNRAAQEIQAAWRGWWVRRNIHDHYRMKGKQYMAAEDLLYCVAFKLHHLMRTYRIPGIYSLRNSHCLSKVEKLLAAMTFKQHNERVRWARARLEAEIGTAKQRFEKCKYMTRIPYPGPNFNSQCPTQCAKFYSEDDADKRMHQILSLYDQVERTDPVRMKVQKNMRHSEKRKKPSRQTQETDFCTDIVNSMRRWKVLNENNVSVDPDVLKTPQNVENFLTEMENLVTEHCYCEPRPQDVDRCN